MAAMLQIARETVAQRNATLLHALTGDWQPGSLRLAGDGVTLRAVLASDATALFATLTTEEVSRFISPPPATIDGFERFVEWAERKRSAGRYICFAVVPAGSDTPVGIFQVRQTTPGSSVAEWGFAIASPFWGTGLFEAAAALVLRYTFEVLGADRLEARAAVVNGRGNGALRKIGAVQECVLRKSFQRRGESMDQALWAILADDWRRSKFVWGSHSRKGRVLSFTRAPESKRA